MELDLLATKVQIPPDLHRSVHRQRLIDTIERGIPLYKLLLVSAPAGYGKTTLLTQWAHTSQFLVCWLSLSAEDNDLERFLRYLLKAWETVQPDVQGSKLGMLLGAMMPDSEAVLSAFINVANNVIDHLVFVLDDYHLIVDSTIHDFLTFIIDHQPPKVHFILAGRGEPPLPLARYRARGELLEFRTEDLHFSQHETEDFFKRVMALDLTPDRITAVQQQMEGWVAGLQLMALSLKRQLVQADQMIVSGQHRFIADYLSEDVLAPLEPDTRQFMLQTSILDRLCASLCNSVTDRENSQALLENLESASLFLTPLDERREWFRYHQLFADCLREMLRNRHPEQVADLHRRAARWYLSHDLSQPAFRHALDSGDVELVVQVAERYFAIKLVSGEFTVLKRWLDALPEAWYAVYPMLGLARTFFLLYTGAFEAGIRSLDAVEQQLLPAENEDTRGHLARVTAVRCAIACFHNDLETAEMYADRALQNLPEEDLTFRPQIYAALGDSYRQNGRWQESKECYLKALDFFTHAPEIRIQSAHIFGALADLELRQGHLRNANGYWRQALVAINDPENWGRLELPVTGWVYIRMGELLYEWNELAEAREHISFGLERAKLGGDVRALIAGYLIAGRLELTEGNTDTALEYLEQARPHVETAQFPHWNSRFERFQLELWLAEDKLRTAVNWADKMLRSDALEERTESEVAQLAIARVLTVKGDALSVERALKLLDRLSTTADEEGRTGVVIEALVLQALVHWRRDKRADSMTVLERALRMAEPEGYVRLFADLGLPMARLLQEARSRNVMADYVAKLLAAFSAEATSAGAAKVPLPEPLTDREQEILALVAAGLTNQEIAEKLVISPETVKKHAGNIYGKLGVSNRTEATARARELDLLG